MVLPKEKGEKRWTIRKVGRQEKEKGTKHFKMQSAKCKVQSAKCKVHLTIRKPGRKEKADEIDKEGRKDRRRK
jgi:hypothetical protein